MQVSVVVTVFNEEASIKALLDSLLHQTKKPDEIVVVDGGSTDHTYELLKSYREKHKTIKLFREKGSIAHGRNKSIKHASFDVIAQTDAGCVAKNDWLEKITKPFEDPNVGLVAGFYHMCAATPFQKAAALFLEPLLNDLITAASFHQPDLWPLEKRYGKKLAAMMKT